MHKLLSDDGVIFVCIDDSEQANLKLLLDEIFGGGNFVNNVIWLKKYSPQNDAKYFSDMHDFIVCYAKNKINWKRNLSKRTVEQNARYKNLDNDPRGIWKSSDLSVKTYSEKTDYTITTPSGRKVNPPAGYCWRVTKEKFEELKNDNRIWFGNDGNNVPSIKRFLSDVQDGTVPVTLWLREEVGDNQDGRQILKRIFNESSQPFETPKPNRLIEKILQISIDKDSIILDSFAGSGTTAHAVLNLNKEDGGNRKFILIEMEDYAETITAERVKRVISGYADVDGTGGEFDYYELGEPLFVENNLNPNLPVEKICEYIYFMETKLRLPAPDKKDNKYLLGVNSGVAYYFFYNPKEDTELDYAFLKTIKTKADEYIIYADNCLLTTDFLQSKRITFKKIPREIPRI